MSLSSSLSIHFLHFIFHGICVDTHFQDFSVAGRFYVLEHNKLGNQIYITESLLNVLFVLEVDSNDEKYKAPPLVMKLMEKCASGRR